MKVEIDGPCANCRGRGRELVEMNLVILGAFLFGSLIAVIVAATLMHPIVFIVGVVYLFAFALAKPYHVCSVCEGSGRQTTIETRSN